MNKGIEKCNEESIDDYLKRDKIITNIARDRYERLLKSMDYAPYSDFWKMNLPRYVENEHDLSLALVKAGAFFKPTLSTAFTEDDIDGSEAVSSLNEIIRGSGIKITGLRLYEGRATAKMIVGKDNDVLMEMDLTDENTGETRTVIGSRLYSHKKDYQRSGWWYSGRNNDIHVKIGDLRALLALLFMMKTVNSRLKEIDSMPESIRMKDPIYSNAMEYYGLINEIGSSGDPSHYTTYITASFSCWQRYAS